MSETKIFIIVSIFVALIAAFAPALAAIVALGQSRKIADKARDDVQKSILEIHVSLNSRLEEMLKLAKAAGYAEGMEVQQNNKEHTQVAVRAAKAEGVLQEKNREK